jgi:hypothetical protein
MNIPIEWTHWEKEVVSLGTATGAVVAGLILHWLIFRVLVRYAAQRLGPSL